MVERFVTHHLASGCHELFLFFSDPEDPAIPWAREQPRVRVEAIHEEVDIQPEGPPRRRSQFGAYVTTDEKLLISAAHANAWSEADWIIHLDADEYLRAEESIGSYLGDIDPQVWMVTVPPLEAVYERFEDSLMDFNTDLFRRALPVGEDSDLLVAQLYGGAAGMFRHGLLGHTSGKSFIRRSPDVTEIGIHAGTHRDPLQPVLFERKRIKLLHFDALSFNRWKRKFRMRADGDFLSYATGPHRLRQRAAFETCMTHEQALGDLFREVLVLEGERLRFAWDNLMVERQALYPAGRG